jgi:hypothetical protein
MGRSFFVEVRDWPIAGGAPTGCEYWVIVTVSGEIPPFSYTSVCGGGSSRISA